MELRFVLIYNDNRTIIKEPIGFDAFKTELSRNDLHGISVEYSDTELEFYDCKAIELIKRQYEENIDSEIYFAVEMSCRNKAFEEVYKGVIDLSTCIFVSKNYTSVKCKIAQIGVFTTFNNRLETDVCVDSITSIDGNTLDEYDFINYEIDVPGKKVLVKPQATDALYTDVVGTGYEFNNGVNVIGYIPGLSESDGAEVGVFNYSVPTIIDLNKLSDIEPFFEYNSDGLDVEESDINFGMTLSLEVRYPNENFYKHIEFVKAQLFLKTETQLTTNESIHFQETDVFNPTFPPGGMGHDYIRRSINFHASLKKIKFKKIYLFCKLTINLKDIPDIAWKDIKTLFSLNVKPSYSYIAISSLALLRPTKCAVNLIHETLSRVSESITNGALKVKTDYYGRPDSGKIMLTSHLPFTTHFGEGSLRCLTNGYKLRRYIYADGSDPRMYVSMKELIKSLNAIDCIGAGFSYESGKWWLRVENWKWFYKDIELFKITHPSDVQRKVDTNSAYTRLKIGYKKYADIEKTYVVDTFHSERNYSNLIKAVDKELKCLSTIVADPYAIEYTRRKSLEKDTKDWRYDEDLFILCLMGKTEETIYQSPDTSLISKGYAVDNGASETGNTFISPETMLNVYISPARNAKKWMEFLSQTNGVSYIKYLSGTRNTNAKAAPFTHPDVAKNIEGVIHKTRYTQTAYDGVVVENSDLEKKKSLLKPETLTFDYPIEREHWNILRLNPYGYISVDGEKCFLKSAKYNMKTGLTEFELIPSTL